MKRLFCLALILVSVMSYGQYLWDLNRMVEHRTNPNERVQAAINGIIRVAYR